MNTSINNTRTNTNTDRKMGLNPPTVGRRVRRSQEYISSVNDVRGILARREGQDQELAALAKDEDQDEHEVALAADPRAA